MWPLKRGWVLAVTVVGASSSLVAAEPVLHEYFDVEGSAALAPSSDAPAGAAWGPELLDPALSSGAVSAPIGRDPGDDYRLDRNTARPDQVVYSDPFTPSIPPFKRLYAYDTVRDDLSLGVASADLRPLSIGEPPGAGDDQFFAQLPIELEPGGLLRIPSVGPQARVVAAQLSPSGRFELLTDSAGNWFVRSPQRVRGELSLHLAIDRRVFGSEFDERASWGGLARRLPALPDNLEEQTAAVLSHLKLDRSLSPKRVVTRLIEYFREFKPSERRPESSGMQLYQDITLSQAGVCRHRAFAFVVTALSLGVPARFIRNEAHAWVEVWDEKLWHRVDLGGAAERLAYSDPPVVSHIPPNDPYAWPADSESGAAMVDRAELARDDSASELASRSPAASEADAAEPSASDDSTRLDAARSEPAAHAPEPAELDISFVASTNEITRGERLSIAGTLSSGGEQCGLLRIDVGLMDPQLEVVPIGTLATDGAGRFEGTLTVPTSVAVGDYQLVLSSPGNDRCAAVSSAAAP